MASVRDTLTQAGIQLGLMSYPVEPDHGSKTTCREFVRAMTQPAARVTVSVRVSRGESKGEGDQRRG